MHAFDAGSIQGGLANLAPKQSLTRFGAMSFPANNCPSDRRPRLRLAAAREQRFDFEMRFYIPLLALFVLTACATDHVPHMPNNVISLGTGTYEWPQKLVVEAAIRAVDRDGAALISVKHGLDGARVTMAYAHGFQFGVDIIPVTPNRTTVQLVNLAPGYPAPTLRDRYFTALDTELGLQ